MAIRQPEVRRAPSAEDEDHRSPLIDYEGSRYAEDFWPEREYEDAAERIALAKLLPLHGEVLVDVGAGHGRLAGLYGGYRRVVLLDPARSVLEKAATVWGSDPRFVFARSSASPLPLARSSCDTIVTIRVLHHIPQLAPAFAEIHRVLRPGGAFVLEYANKRNLKEILRAAIGRSERAPFSLEPAEALPKHFTFHPRHVAATLKSSRFAVDRQLAVSAFRTPLLKKWVPPSLLARLDGSLQEVGAILKLTPSVFVRAIAEKPSAARSEGGIFACPDDATPLLEQGAGLRCPQCGRGWESKGGIYDFTPRD